MWIFACAKIIRYKPKIITKSEKMKITDRKNKSDERWTKMNKNSKDTLFQ
jgi:hypothetical protein